MASNLEALLLQQIKLVNLPQPQSEFRFAAVHVGHGRGLRERLAMAGLRDWRFDIAWPEYGFAVEVEGVTVAGGRHQHIDGFRDDCDKYHAALDIGWTVYRVTDRLIKNGKAIRLIEKYIGAAYAR